ncbi:MAG: HDIG domain-containing protein [Chloroflexi bacterium]|nr:HDIG domain-containing protein [Chloroflexota bacterium]
MDKLQRLKQLIPSITGIKNAKLRKGVLAVWVRAWEESAWNDPAECPFIPDSPDCSLVQHTNFIVETVLAMASSAKSIWNIGLNTDFLIAGAVLHDVSKLVEFAPGAVSEIGENLVHASYGVHLALNAGLPLQVVNMIGAHTPQVYLLPKSPEGVLLCYADYAAADIFHLLHGKSLLLSSVDFRFVR